MWKAAPALNLASSRARWGLLLALLTCLALAAVAIIVSRVHVGPQEVALKRSNVLDRSPPTYLSRAKFASGGTTYPQEVPRPSEFYATTLPDNWDGVRPDDQGYVWYAIEVPTAFASWERASVYLPASGMNAELWVNGIRAGGTGRMLPQQHSRHFYTPQLIEIPRGLWADQHLPTELHILVLGHPGYRSGLSGVWLGEHDDLLSSWRMRRFWQIEGNAATIVINFSMAVFVLLVGWRGAEHGAYRWFGTAVTVWALRNLNYWVTNPAISDLLFAELCVSGEAWFTALFSIFSMRFSQLQQPGYQPVRWLQPFALAYAVCATLYFVSADNYAAANAGFAAIAFIGVGLTLFGLFRLVHLAFVNTTPHLVAVACGALVYFVLLLNDFEIGVNRSSLGEIYLRQYAALPLFIAVTATLAKRYGDALRSAKDAAISLQSQVEAQRTELQANYLLLREAEREQARAEERSRVMGDLHDGLGLHLATALRQARSEKASRSLLEASLQDCLDELRVAVDSLDELERDPLSILGSLRFRLAPRFAALGIDLQWDIAPDLDSKQLPVLGASEALNLARIVQELLGNALKHSQATQVRLSLSPTHSGVCVRVADNGIGFDRTSVKPGRGLGNLEGRAQRLGARLTWKHSAPGTVVEVHLEYPQ